MCHEKSRLLPHDRKQYEHDIEARIQYVRLGSEGDARLACLLIHPARTPSGQNRTFPVFITMS